MVQIPNATPLNQYITEADYLAIRSVRRGVESHRRADAQTALLPCAVSRRVCPGSRSVLAESSRTEPSIRTCVPRAR